MSNLTGIDWLQLKLITFTHLRIIGGILLFGMFFFFIKKIVDFSQSLVSQFNLIQQYFKVRIGGSGFFPVFFFLFWRVVGSHWKKVLAIIRCARGGMQIFTLHSSATALRNHCHNTATNIHIHLTICRLDTENVIVKSAGKLKNWGHLRAWKKQVSLPDCSPA